MAMLVYHYIRRFHIPEDQWFRFMVMKKTEDITQLDCPTNDLLLGQEIVTLL